MKNLLDFYLKPSMRIMLVDGAEVEGLDKYEVERCKRGDVPSLGGGIYDAIVFREMPGRDVLKASFGKVYWGGVVVVLGVEDLVEEAGVSVLKGRAGPLVFRRPPAPPDWTREYYLGFQPRGRDWNAVTKAMHPSYRKKIERFSIDWRGKVVAEFGCGRGEVTRLIAEAGAKRVYAVDRSPAAIELVGEFCADLENVVPTCADACEWESPEPLDVIVAFDFVEHVPESDLDKMYRRWYNNANPGCVVAIITPLGPDAVRDHHSVQSPGKMRRQMEAVGFKYKGHKHPGKDGKKFSARFVK